MYWCCSFCKSGAHSLGSLTSSKIYIWFTPLNNHLLFFLWCNQALRSSSTIEHVEFEPIIHGWCWAHLSFLPPHLLRPHHPSSRVTTHPSHPCPSPLQRHVGQFILAQWRNMGGRKTRPRKWEAHEVSHESRPPLLSWPILALPSSIASAHWPPSVQCRCGEPCKEQPTMMQAAKRQSTKSLNDKGRRTLSQLALLQIYLLFLSPDVPSHKPKEGQPFLGQNIFYFI